MGSSELVSINGLVDIVASIAGIKVVLPIMISPRRRVVRGRNSDNTMILNRLGWEPSITFRAGFTTHLRSGSKAN
ncbi:MAG: hypothetical protein R2710_27965 [Acidimicrobiales bacterium]